MKINLYKVGIAWRIELDGVLYNAVQFSDLKKISPASARVRFDKFQNDEISETDLLWVGKVPVDPTKCNVKKVRKDGKRPGNKEWYALGDEDRSHILEDL